MILVVGGSFQGKLEFSRGLCEEKEMKIIEGKELERKNYGKLHILNRFQDLVRHWLREEIDLEFAMKDFLLENRNLIVVADEVGYGIVPIEASERRYREAVGHCCCMAAAEAVEVYRVVCGIGVRIK